VGNVTLSPADNVPISFSKTQFLHFLQRLSLLCVVKEIHLNQKYCICMASFKDATESRSGWLSWYACSASGQSSTRESGQSFLAGSKVPLKAKAKTEEA
jgi:hypothetical protein